MAQLYFYGSRDDLRRELARFVEILGGHGSDPQRLREQVLIAIGIGAMSDIKKAFEVKSQGGRGEDGIKWAPLAPSTAARRRVGHKDVAADQAIKDRERIRKREEAKALKRLLVSLPPDEARARAKRIGQIRATRKTGKTKLQTLGGRTTHNILRDTGILLNSLSPGLVHEALTQQGIIVGTNVPYAAVHQFGAPSRGIPARLIFPDPVPKVWSDRWLKIARDAIALALKRHLENR